MSEKITIFDIEELNNDPVSICSIGIVVLEDMKVKETFYSLIRPPKLTFVLIVIRFIRSDHRI